MATEPIPRGDQTWQLSAQTLAWLAARPHVRRMVRSIWDKLADLEQDGHDAGTLAALRSQLIHHQPLTRTGRCRACHRFSWRRLWRRRPFPCTVWMTTHIELQELFGGGIHLSAGVDRTMNARRASGYPVASANSPRNEPGAG
jgi:hypothetical protein